MEKVKSYESYPKRSCILQGGVTMIPTNFRPLLAIDYQKVRTQPKNLMASVKLDGIRCTIFGGVAYSRTLKPIPNRFIQSEIYKHREFLEGVDCEIIVGEPNAGNVFSETTSVVMSHDKQVDFKLYCFDYYNPELPFNARYAFLMEDVKQFNCPIAVLLPHLKIKNWSEVEEFEKDATSQGYEGIMLRDADGLYKCGRSGTKNPELQKVKQFTDAEFKVVGFEPKYHNANEAKTNELGRTSRSTSKDGMIALEELGALILEVPDGSGRTFSCGSGFNEEQRKKLWEIRHTIIGDSATIKFFEVGMQEGIPRFPIFKGLRWKEDI